MNRPVVAMDALITLPMIRLKLFNVRDHILHRPPLNIPGVKVASLRATVFAHVDGRATPEGSANGHDCCAAIEMLRGLGLMEDGVLAGGCQKAKEEGWMNDSWVLVVVDAAFNHEDAEGWGCRG